MRIWDFGAEQKLGQVWELNKLLDKHSKAAAKANAEAGAGKVAALRCPLEAHAAEGHQHWVTCMDMDERSSVLYSGSMDKTLKAWDMYSGRCMRTYSGHADWVLALHVRSRMLYSAAEDGCVRLWKLSTMVREEEGAGAEEGGCWEAHEVAIKATAQEGDFLVTGDVRGAIKYWNLLDGACEVQDKTGVGVVTCLALPYHAAERAAAELRLDGKESVERVGGGEGRGPTVFVGGSEGVVEWRELGRSNQRGAALLASFLHAPARPVTALAVKDGTLWTGGEDGAVKAWGVEDGHCLQLYLGSLSPIRALALLPDQGLLCTAGSDLRLWELDSGEVAAVLHWKAHEALAVGGGGGGGGGAVLLLGAAAGQLRCYPLPARAAGRDKGKGGRVGGVVRPLVGTLSLRPRTPPDKPRPTRARAKTPAMNPLNH